MYSEREAYDLAFGLSPWANIHTVEQLFRIKHTTYNSTTAPFTEKKKAKHVWKNVFQSSNLRFSYQRIVFSLLHINIPNMFKIIQHFSTCWRHSTWLRHPAQSNSILLRRGYGGASSGNFRKSARSQEPEDLSDEDMWSPWRPWHVTSPWQRYVTWLQIYLAHTCSYPALKLQGSYSYFRDACYVILILRVCARARNCAHTCKIASLMWTPDSHILSRVSSLLLLII